MLERIPKPVVIAMAVIAAVILIAISWIWWYRVSVTPERVFKGTLAQSMRTSSVGVEASQDQQGTSVVQTTQFTLAKDKNIAHGNAVMKREKTTIKTETIGTKDADYTRYTSIDTDEKSKDGKKLDTSKIIGIWAKSEGQKQTASQAGSAQLLGQAVLGIGLPLGSVPVPIGNPDPDKRTQILELMERDQIYRTDFAKVKREHKNGRLTYTYDVTVQPILYVRAMKQFAKSIGFAELDQVEPNSYQESQPLKFKLVVDARSRRITEVSFPGSGYKQKYIDYGVPVKVDIPGKTITPTELQQKLQAL